MINPGIKAAHRPIRRPDGAIWIGGLHFGLAFEIQDDSGLIWAVCQRMDGSLSLSDLVTAVSREFQVHAGDVRQVIEFLISSGWVEDAAGAPPSNLNPRERDRYVRSIQLQSWLDQRPRTSPYELQSKLKESRVTVLGLGGIGSSVAASLTASGVGRIHCVDGDRVELSNLNRQLLFTEADIGAPKVQVGVDRLRGINSDVEITGADLMIDGPDELTRQVRDSDMFVLCADRPRDLELWSDRASRALGVPWVIASYAGPKVALGAFIPGKTPCYSCLLAGERQRLKSAGMADLIDLQQTPGFNPVMAMNALISGNLAAFEIISYLLGWNVQTAGGQLHCNLADYRDQHFFAATAQPDCTDCAGSAHAGA